MEPVAYPANFFVPDSTWIIDGRQWISFLNDGTHDAIKSFPQILKYRGKLFARQNSHIFDGWFHYKQVSAHQIATPVHLMNRYGLLS
jgi:hypothetical protein